MHAILFLPNDYILCWAGRVPAGTLPRALARWIEREGPGKLLGLVEYEKPENEVQSNGVQSNALSGNALPGNTLRSNAPSSKSQPLGDFGEGEMSDRGEMGGAAADDQPAANSQPAADCLPPPSRFGKGARLAKPTAGLGPSAVLPPPPIPPTASTPAPENSPSAHSHPADHTPGQADQDAPLDDRAAPQSVPASGWVSEVPEDGSLPPAPEGLIAMQKVLDVLVGAAAEVNLSAARHQPLPGPPDRYGLAQRFIVPPNLKLRVAILPDALLVRADPPMVPCLGERAGSGAIPRIPTLTAEERGVLRLLSRMTVREVSASLGCSQRRVFYVLAGARRKVGRMIKELK